MAIAENTAPSCAGSHDSVSLTEIDTAGAHIGARLLDIEQRLAAAACIVGVCAEACEEHPYAPGALIEARHTLEQLGDSVDGLAREIARSPASAPGASSPVQLVECSDGVLAVPLGRAWRLTIESIGDDLEMTGKIVAQVADLSLPLARELLRQLPATVLSRCTAAHAAYAAELFAGAGARVSLGEAS